MPKGEYILCSAVWYDDGKVHHHQPLNIETGVVVCGFRHHNCLGTAHALGRPDGVPPSGTKQGFLTSENRFVNRSDARIIANASGQLEGRKVHSKHGLFSEDLW